MDQQPWGLSGEQFLEWYFIALGCAVALAVVIRILPKLSGGGKNLFRLTAVETGFLAGGPERAVEAAVAELLAAGALRADSNGLLRSTGKHDARNGVASRVLIRTQAGHSLSDLVSYLKRQSALEEVGGGLVELGLVVRPELAARFRLAAALPMLAVFVTGGVRWVNGLFLGRAIGFLTPSVLVALVLFIVILRLRRERHLRTLAGDRTLREFRRAPVIDAATAVALGGVGKYPDARVAEALQKSSSPPRRQLTGTSSEAAAGFFFGGGGGGCGGGGGGGGCSGGGGGGGGCGG
jgi:uncharacterized protein (TIGR04222 family)